MMFCPLVLTLLQLRSTAFTTPASSRNRPTVDTPATNTHDYYFTLSSLRRNEDDYYVEDDDDNDDDEDPSEFSMSPQEFLKKLESNISGNNEIPASMPSITSKSKPRPTPRIRQQILGSGKSKESTMFVCSNCNAQYLQWRGRCGTCQEWNTIQQVAVKKRSTFATGDAPSTGMGMRSNIIRPSKKHSSWLDGVTRSGEHELDNGQGPVRLTDVYEEEDIISNSKHGHYHYPGRLEERLQIPHDQEMNSVLGGGIMPGSITLLGGDPGVGKSTLLLQMAGELATLAERSPQFLIGMGPPTDSSAQEKQTTRGHGPVLYVSGEENAKQIASRALRLDIQDPELLLWCETDADVIVDTILNSMDDHSQSSYSIGYEQQTSRQKNELPLSQLPSLVIIDSIQTMICDAGGHSSAGGITQVRECVSLFLRLAKSVGVPIILVGHVTKSGDVAGPRTVEHMVDSVLYLEGSHDTNMSSLRVLRAAKNRFGSAEEVGVYQMDGRQDGRLVPISDPSSFFLATRQDKEDAEGCAISVVLEGIRSMAVEVQALVSFSPATGGYSGRRVVDGISNSRLQLLLAVLQKRYGVSFHRQDVYVNVVGGLHLGKGPNCGGSDLAVVMAVVSSLFDIPVRSDTAFVGEIGLLGELRPVNALEKRVGEAKRMGFSRIVTPSTIKKMKGKKVSGARNISANGITQVMCENLLEAINSGLVKSLPTVKTMSGPKLRKVRREKSNGEELDVIVDDEDVDFL